jgi:hypothetical protein
MKSFSAISLLHSKLTRLTSLIASTSNQLDSDLKAEETHIEFLEKTLDIIRVSKDTLKKANDYTILNRRNSHSKIELNEPKMIGGYLGVTSQQLTPRTSGNSFLWTNTSKKSQNKLSYQVIPKIIDSPNRSNDYLRFSGQQNATSLRPETTLLVGKIKKNLNVISSRVGKLKLNENQGKSRSLSKKNKRLRLYSNDQDDFSSQQEISQIFQKNGGRKPTYTAAPLNFSPNNSRLAQTSTPSTAQGPSQTFNFNSHLMRIPEKESLSNSRISSPRNQSRKTEDKLFGLYTRPNEINLRHSVEHIPSKDEISIMLSEKDAPAVQSQKKISGIAKFERQTAENRTLKYVVGTGTNDSPPLLNKGSYQSEKNSPENLQPRALFKRKYLAK